MACSGDPADMFEFRFAKGGAKGLLLRGFLESCGLRVVDQAADLEHQELFEGVLAGDQAGPVCQVLVC